MVQTQCLVAQVPGTWREWDDDGPFVPPVPEVHREHGGLLFQPQIFRAEVAANTLILFTVFTK